MFTSVECLRDPYGNWIIVGSRVAYNYQGQVRIGLVTNLEKKEHTGRWSSGTEYRISVKEQRKGFTSKVTNPANMVVIPNESS